jgi:hypothetical protein
MNLQLQVKALWYQVFFMRCPLALANTGDATIELSQPCSYILHFIFKLENDLHFPCSKYSWQEVQFSTLCSSAWYTYFSYIA